jgi:beta-lactamase superfamily II metal-dependent hydrolase
MPRGSDGLTLWSLALFVECLLHPDAPASLSVQLSYAATLGLILATGPIATLLRDRLPGGGVLAAVGRQGRPRPRGARVAGQRFLDATRVAIAASLAAVTATAPFVWSRFGEWCPAGILAKPLLALPIAWTLLVGWVWLLAPGLVPEVLLDVPLAASVRFLEFVDALPGSPCALPPRPFALLLAASALAVAAYRRLGTRRDGAFPARGAALFAAVLLLPWSARPAAIEIHALDVGGGTAVALRTPGGAVWVFDAGSRDRPGVDREALGPLLRRFDARGIGVVVSHTDRDHDGALPWVLERFPPRVFAGALSAHIAERLPHGTARIEPMRGRTKLPSLDRGEDGITLEISRSVETAGTEGSFTLEILAAGELLVLCGDAEEEGLSAWIRERPWRAPARLLLLPHHGSQTEHLGRLLLSVRPAEVWISGAGPPVLGPELDRRRIPWLATAIEGPLRRTIP